MGVTNMRERAALVGGTLEVESSPGAGTTIFVRVPVAKPGGGGVDL
jgi:signal transduction histidine kinase